MTSGSQNAKVVENGHTNCAFYGRGRSYARSDCERLWRQLVVDKILGEKLFVTAQDHTVCYIQLGCNALEVAQGRLKVTAFFHLSRGVCKVKKIRVNYGSGCRSHSEFCCWKIVPK